MEVITRHLKELFPLPNNFLSAFQDISFAFFDIETTGLSAGYHQVILIGLLYVQDEQIVIEQYFAHRRNQEKMLLQAFQNKIKDFDMLLSYNGNTFDIPFLNKRFDVHGIPYKIDSYKSFDMLKFVRQKKHLLSLADCKLKSLEKSLGIYRQDTITGKESVELYHLYEKYQGKAVKEKILLHNHDDLYYFSHCLRILDKVDLEEFLASTPLIFSLERKKICYVDELSFKSNMLHVKGHFPSASIDRDYLQYDLGFNFEFHHKSHQFHLTVPISKGSLSTGQTCLYVHLDSFPFPSTSIGHRLPKNIVILKEGRHVKMTVLYDFLRNSLRYLLRSL